VVLPWVPAFAGIFNAIALGATPSCLSARMPFEDIQFDTGTARVADGNGEAYTTVPHLVGNQKKSIRRRIRCSIDLDQCVGTDNWSMLR
jgi:hypothetical protein